MLRELRLWFKDPLLVWVVCSSFAVSTGYTHLVLSTNDASRYSLTKAIVTRGSLEIGETLALFEAQAGRGDRAVFEGRTYSDKAPLGSFLGVVPASVAHVVFSDDQEYWRIFLTSIFLAALPLAITGALVYRLALGYGASKELAILLASGVVFGTNLLYWSTVMFSHALSTCLLLSSFYLLQRNGERSSQFLAGVLAGLAVASDYYLILLLPILFLAGSVSRYGLRSGYFVVGSALAGLFPALYHMAIFGNPLVLPYRYQATFGHMHENGVYGMVAPSLKALWDLSFSWTYGLFFYNPVLLSAFFCFPALYRRSRRDAYLVSISTAILFLAISSIRDPSYGLGFSWGPRYLVPLVPFLILPAAAGGLSPLKRRSLHVLIVVSICLNYFIVNLFVVPPRFEALEYMSGRGLESIRHYGGFNLIAQWHKFVKGEPLSALTAGMISILFLILPVVSLIWLLRRARRQRADGDGHCTLVEAAPDVQRPPVPTTA